MDDIERATVATRVLSQLLTASISLHDPGAGVAAAAASPLVDEMSARWLHRQRQKTEYMVAAAAEGSGLKPEDFVERITADPVKLALLGDALTTASVTALDAKVAALGRALAAGALAVDDADVEAERLWVQLVMQVEAPHLRFLAALGEPLVAVYAGEEVGIQMFDRTVAAFNAIGPNGSPLLKLVPTTVETLGLAQWRYGDSYPASYGLGSGAFASDRIWSLTSSGNLVLERFVALGGRDDPASASSE